MKKKILIGVLALLILILAGFLWWQNQNIGSQKVVIKNQTAEIKSKKEWLDSLLKAQQKVELNLTANEPIVFAQNKQISVSKSDFNLLTEMKAEDLALDGCRADQNEEYFAAILSKFSSEDRLTEYYFKYNDPVFYTVPRFTVTVIPNKLGYKNIDDFRKDFGVCSAGGKRYSHAVSDDYLLFISSCGSGFAPESLIGNEQDCDKAKDIILSSLKLK